MRNVQKELVELVTKCIETKTPLVVHAPTGLGKTAAALAPALTVAKDKKLTIFFLTSRHTQHLIGMETLKAIKKKFDYNPGCVSVVGKKHLCSQPGVSTMYSDDFSSFCKHLREEKACSFYENARTDKGEPTIKAASTAIKLVQQSPVASEVVLMTGTNEDLCPYELALLMAQSSKVIIADYNYIFNPFIRKGLLGKLEKPLEDCVIIVDEGHNLPSRLRELLTYRLNSITIKRAIAEAKAADFPAVQDFLIKIGDHLNGLSKGLYRDQEKLVTKDAFIKPIMELKPLEEMTNLFEIAADAIREEKKSSAIGAVAAFLNGWNEGETGFTRILSTSEQRGERVVTISHQCLDPSMISKQVIDEAHCTILMSGTLTPTSMFVDVLGFPKNTIQKEFPSPFPTSNKCCLVVPSVTTKFSERSSAQYQKIADTCANIVNNTPGCSAVFFPSYAVRDSVAQLLTNACKKTVFMEDSKATKEDREAMLRRFAGYKDLGAVLLGVAAGSFGEGVDLPGILKCVIVVGIPLDRPDLETKELIAYYDKLYKKGWDYGYTLPAITKTLQNAGRCIRSETDRGVLVFLDERYAQPMYARCFPKDWNPKITFNPIPIIQQFFNQK